jgi:hypothetical protein
MTEYTNMLWPDDPYGTGQLWRKEPQLLAAFGISSPCGASLGDVAYAVVYLRLHRTRRLDLGSDFSFGFRAVTAADSGEAAEVVETLDLDAMRARRLSSVVAGYRLGADLQASGRLDENGTNLRGLRSLVHVWNAGQVRGSAEPVEVSACVPGADLKSKAAASGIDVSTARHAWTPRTESGHAARTDRHEDESIALGTVERALIIGLIAGRHVERCTWASSLNVGDVLSSNLADCFPTQDFGHGR